MAAGPTGLARGLLVIDAVRDDFVEHFDNGFGTTQLFMKLSS
jgi:hypothetical protein